MKGLLLEGCTTFFIIKQILKKADMIHQLNYCWSSNSFTIWSLKIDLQVSVVMYAYYNFCVDFICKLFFFTFQRSWLVGLPYKYILNSGQLNKHEFVRQQVQHCGSSFVSEPSLFADRSVTQQAVNERRLASLTLPGFIHPGTDGRSVVEAWRP